MGGKHLLSNAKAAEEIEKIEKRDEHARSAQKGRRAGGRARGEQIAARARREFHEFERLKASLQRRADAREAPRPTDRDVSRAYYAKTKSRRKAWSAWTRVEQEREIKRQIGRVSRGRTRKPTGSISPKKNPRLA
jgi:hypothetical protein